MTGWVVTAVVVVVVAVVMAGTTSALSEVVVSGDEVMPAADFTKPEFSELLQRVISVGAADLEGVTAAQAVILTGLFLGVLILFREFLLGIGQRLPHEEKVAEKHYHSHPSYHTYGHHSYQRSVGADSYFTRVLYGLDTAHALLDRLEVDELACRRLAVCEAERAAPASPTLAFLISLLRPTLLGSADYTEAQDAGAALQDCALLFSECPASLTRALWGSH